MPKTDINKPLNAILVHYSDFEYITDKLTYLVQIFCRQLILEGKKGQLWVYPNQDKDFEYMPDVIYKSIKQAADSANCRFYQMGTHYGKTKKEVWGL